MNGITVARGAVAVGALVAFTIGGTVLARPKSNTAGRATSDATFAKKADQSDLAEVKLAQLAESKTQNPSVRSFAQRMIHDHSKTNQKLQNVASQNNINLPAQPNEKQQDTYDRLSKLTGTTFDRAYAANQVKDHEHDIAAFKKEAKAGQNPQIKQLAQTTLPVLHEHLTLARQMYRNVENQTNSGAAGVNGGYNPPNGGVNGGANGNSGGATGGANGGATTSR
jgi:putative membrane protein